MSNIILTQKQIKELRLAHEQTKNLIHLYKIKAVFLLGSGWSLERISEILLLDTDTLLFYVYKYKKDGLAELLKTHSRDRYLGLIDYEIGIGVSYAGFGELLQGVLQNDRHFLVTLPINLKTQVIINPNGSDTLEVYPDNKHKIKRFADLFFEHYKLPVRGKIAVNSEIPMGKGLSSSTADIVAAYRAFVQAFKLKYLPERVEPLIRLIEPSDGLLYDGVIVYYHREVSLLKNLFYYPSLIIVALDEGGIVDTIEYNKVKKTIMPDEKKEFDILLQRFILAAKERDLKTIGAIATRSTELNQKYNYKPSFNDLLTINQEVDGLGIMCAHSGTYLGIILDGDDYNLSAKINLSRSKFAKLRKKAEVFCSQYLAKDNF